MQAMTGEQVASLLSALARESLDCQSAEVRFVKEGWTTLPEIHVIATWSDGATHGVRAPIYDGDLAEAYTNAIDGHRSWRLCELREMREARKAA